MTDKKATLLVDQLNPILRQSTGFIRRLGIDYDNQDILLINSFGAILCRIYYGTGQSIRSVLHSVVEELI